MGLSKSVMDRMMLLYLDTMVSSLVAVTLSRCTLVDRSSSLADSGSLMLVADRGVRVRGNWVTLAPNPNVANLEVLKITRAKMY